MKLNQKQFSNLFLFFSIVTAIFITIGVPFALASLNFTGNTITGNAGAIIDATGTISIGSSTATGVTIGNANATVTITGATTTVQNLVVNGASAFSNIATSESTVGMNVQQEFNPSTSGYSTEVDGSQFLTEVGGSNMTSTNTAYARALWGDSSIVGSTNIDSIYGITGSSGIGSGASGSASSSYGVHGYVHDSGTGSIVNAFPVYSECRTSSMGYISTCVGFYSDVSEVNNSTIGTVIGMKLVPPLDASVTYYGATIGGPVRIGDNNLTSPGDELEVVNGSVSLATTTVSNLFVNGPSSGLGANISTNGDMVLGEGSAIFFDNNYSYNSGNYIESYYPNILTFNTAGIERLRVDASGSVEIGTSTQYGNTTLTVDGGYQAVGTTPTLGVCGSGSSMDVTTTNVDQYGTIDTAGTVTSCTMNFAAPAPWGNNTPTCNESDNSTAVTGDVSAVSSSSVTFSFSASLGTGKIFYHCN